MEFADVSPHLLKRVRSSRSIDPRLEFLNRFDVLGVLPLVRGTRAVSKHSISVLHFKIVRLIFPSAI